MARYGKDVLTGPVTVPSYERWAFEKFLDEIIHLSEIDEIPGVQEARQRLIRIMWEKFPNECKDIGLRDFA